jgi:hypothetical protein
MALVQADIPQKRGGFAGLMNMFTQGVGFLQAGMKGKEAYTSLMGGETAGASVGGAGGGGAGYGLGLPAMKSAFGSEGAAASTGSETAASGAGSTALGTAAGAASGAGAVLSEYQYQKGLREGTTSQDPGRYQTGKSDWYQKQQVNMASGFGNPVGATKTNLSNLGKSVGLGLTETQPDKMSAMERRYENYGNASNAIADAQAALKDSNLSTADRRSIYRKLEQARTRGA